MQAIAQDWLVLDLTAGSGKTLGIITALQFMRNLVIAPWGGLVADRYRKRRILMLTQAVMGILALSLGTLVVGGVVRIWQVYVFALALGLAGSINNPGLQSFVVERC